MPGSIVHADYWRGSTQIPTELNLDYRTVNHSEGPVDPLTGVHTNTIETKWNGLKRKISIRGLVKEHLDAHLMEQIWRRKHSGTLWDSFI